MSDTPLHSWLRGGKHSTECTGPLSAWLAQNISREATILDAGCGNGELLQLLADSGFPALYGCDIEPGHVAHAKGLLAYRADIVECDFVNQVPFPGVEYDVITAINWLHNDWCAAGHATGIPARAEQAGRELAIAKAVRRQLKPGGLFVHDCLDLGRRAEIHGVLGWPVERQTMAKRTLYFLRKPE